MKGQHKIPESVQSLKESKKARTEAWKRLLPIVLEINEQRQSGEKPFETEEVRTVLTLVFVLVLHSYHSEIEISNRNIYVFMLVIYYQYSFLDILYHIILIILFIITSHHIHLIIIFYLDIIDLHVD